MRRKPNKRVQVVDVSASIVPGDLRWREAPVYGSVVASPVLTALVQGVGRTAVGAVCQRASDDGALHVRVARGDRANLRIVMATTVLSYPMVPGVWESEYYRPAEGSAAQVMGWWASIPAIGATADGYHQVGLCNELQSTWGVLAVYPAVQGIDVHRYWAYGSPSTVEPSSEAVWRDVITSIIATHETGVEWWYGPQSSSTQTGTRSQTVVLIEWDI